MRLLPSEKNYHQLYAIIIVIGIVIAVIVIENTFSRCHSTHLLGTHLLNYSRTRCNVALTNVLLTLTHVTFYVSIPQKTTVPKLN